MFKNGLSYLWVSALVFLADWGSKALVQSHLSLYEAVAVVPGLNIALYYNRGAAFSFLSNSAVMPNLIFGALALIISVIILFWLYKQPRSECIMNLALTLILGGALGNLWDRLRYQHVVDFLDVYAYDWHWPVFNLADAAVCLGAILIIWKWSKVK